MDLSELEEIQARISKKNAFKIQTRRGLMPNKIMLIIASAPPYEPGEEFLLDEYAVMADYFTEIIVIHHKEDYAPSKSILDKFKLLYFPYLPSRKENFFSLISILMPEFWRE